jgi:hypothetical protein
MREMDFKTPGSGHLEPKKKVSGTAGEETKWGSKRTTRSSVVCLFVCFFWWGTLESPISYTQGEEIKMAMKTK